MPGATLQTPLSPQAPPPWWHEFFDDDYAAYGLANDPPERIERVVNFIVQTLELSPGQSLFDQCCGIGRLSIPLAQRGARIIGVDRVRSYIKRAQDVAAQHDLPCEFHEADAFEFAAPRPCEAAINWFTSFGYQPDDDKNIEMLHRVWESLKPGGRFMMDYLNIPKVIAEYKPSFVDRPVGNGLDGLMVIHETKLDFKNGMACSDWTFLYPDGRRMVRRVETRMYMPHELVGLLERAGFVDVQLLGSADGEAFDRLSRRCIPLARKPG